MTNSVLISHEQIDTSTKNAVAYRVLYNSYDLRGNATTSSGLVIAPATPGENRKVLSWTHGTTGLGDAACPSAAPDPASELKTYFQSGSTTQYDYGVPGLQQFIDDGWVVVSTDYQGLGTPGMHQYSVNRTNALDGLNIVKAAGELPVGAGTKFACAGWSQGGGTAAAIAELDAADYGDLTLVGTAPLSPGVPSVALTDPKGIGAGLSGADVAPDGHLIMSLAAFPIAFGDKIQLSDVFTPLGIKIIQENWNIQPVHHLSDILTRAYHHEGPVMAIDQSKVPAWVEVMKASSAAQFKPVCPVHVYIDTQNGGSVIPVSWQTDYVDAVKALGGTIDSTNYPNDDHFSLPQSCIGDVKSWLETLF